jgi:multidrug efflux pump subunit AcrB
VSSPTDTIGCGAAPASSSPPNPSRGDLDEIDHWAPILLRALQRIPLLRDVATDQQIAGPTVRLQINRDAASRLGVATQAIDDTLYDAFGPRKIAQFFTQQNSYWVVLEVDPRFQLDPDALDLIYVPSVTGRQVPLSALVERKRTVRSLSVSHQGQFILIAFHYELSVVALIGIILLIGIVKKNAIMMIDFALDAERTQAMSPEDSIYRAAVLRFRPIMMTTFAAFLGAVPLALGHGTGAEIRQPLGFAIVGGLLLSQFLTLYTTPVIYLALDRFRGKRVVVQPLSLAELPIAAE